MVVKMSLREFPRVSLTNTTTAAPGNHLSQLMHRFCDIFGWSSVLEPVLSQPNLQLLIISSTATYQPNSPRGQIRRHADLWTGFCTCTSVLPCQYHSTIALYSFIHLPPTLYDVFLPTTSDFPCQYHSTIVPYSSSFTHCCYPKDKIAKPGTFQKAVPF